MSGPPTHDGTDPDRPEPRTTWGRATSDGDRGVSELLGAILLFGLIVAVMVLLQANAVPSQNERVEFDHNQRVQADVLELSSAAEDVAATGRDRSSVLELAPEYPNRFLLLNPGRAQGRVTTTEADFAIENAVADGETGDYWNGTARPFDGRALEYVPNYNVYRNAPDTVLAHGTVTDRFPDGAVTAIGGSSPVDGRRISLMALDGQRSEARGGALSVELVPLSTRTETVTVTDDGSGPVVLRLQTDLAPAEWEEILESERVANGGFVTAVQAGPGDTVEIRLQQGETYQLRLSKVGVGTGLTDPAPAYLTARGDTSPTLEPGEERELTVQVRDGYNAPEPGVEVTFASSGSGNLDGTTVVTDENGEATVTYTAGAANGTVTATVDGGTGAAGDQRTVRYDVHVDRGTDDPGQGSQPGELNPGGNDAFQLRSASLTDCQDRERNNRVVNQYDDQDGDDCRITANFVNTGQGRVIDEVRISVYSASQAYSVGTDAGYSTGNPGPRERPNEWQFSTTSAFAGSYAGIGSGYVDITNQTVPSTGAGSTPSFSFAFRLDSKRYNAMEGDFYVLTFKFSDGTTSSYIVSPQEP